MKQYSTIPLQRGLTYHIYNQGNNRENLFREKRNYYHFLNLYTKHIVPIANTYAYCLLPNHFHFCLRLKTEAELQHENADMEPQEKAQLRQRPPSRALANFFNAYTRGFNRAYERTGALFKRPFQRIPLQTNQHLYRLIIYIHQNPQKHGFVDDFRAWPFSSYHAISSTHPTQIDRQTVLDWFGDTQAYRSAHENIVSSETIHGWIGDDTQT